jgi:hypothetical protein
MKLRNKKTGEIGKLHCDMNVSPAKYGVFEDTDIRGHYWEYDSLAELNEDWEDYKPKEPLIKDEKIRKAVRAWVEANEISQQIQFDRYTSGFSASDDGHNLLSMISFDGYVFNCVDGKYYTIAELCGEE